MRASSTDEFCIRPIALLSFQALEHVMYKSIKPETFKIGKACSYVPKRSGYLYAYANDAWNCYGNNHGHVALRFEVKNP